MHEHSITNEVVHQIVHACEDNKIASPKRIVVRVGELTSYKKDPILFYFEAVKKSVDVLRDASLIVEMVEGKIKCGECSEKSVVEASPLILCPKCESADVKVLEGDQVKIVSIE
ncbi:hydrogenase maturation nickel metallochaperone HypA [Candidatus Woesearchaeota archaeon]|nr:hydrogenase maturation nickel metallochaperone HypA [Candidatus Woesearchaeota archaeon]